MEAKWTPKWSRMAVLGVSFCSLGFRLHFGSDLDRLRSEKVVIFIGRVFKIVFRPLRQQVSKKVPKSLQNGAEIGPEITKIGFRKGLKNKVEICIENV